MKAALTAVALLASALTVPAVRTKTVWLLARATRGTNVHYVPAPDRR